MTEILCPHCTARNRLPPDRDPRAGRCGRCHRPLVPAEPVELDAGDLARFLSRSPQPVLVDFHAPWCGPCRLLAPAFVEAARLLEPDIRCVRVDVDRAPGLAARLGVRAVPTLILFKDGREIARHSGLVSREGIVALARDPMEEKSHA